MTKPKIDASTIPAPTFNEFTKESVGQLLNTNVISDSLVDKINEVANSDQLADHFKANLVSFTSVLEKGVFSPAQYVSAVQYVSYRLMGDNTRVSWEKTFPDRCKTLMQRGATAKEISSHSSAYNTTKLVTMITQQSLVPSYIVNRDYFQEAVNVQVSLMRDDTVSAKVRSDAAHRVMEYTVMPEALTTNNDEIVEKSLDVIAQLARSMDSLANAKQGAIIDGFATSKEIAEMPLYEEGVIIDE